MRSPPPTPRDLTRGGTKAQKRFVGGLMMAVGGMIATLCGLCTSVLGAQLLGIMIKQGTPPSGFLITLAVLVIFGCAPTAVGVFVFLKGLSTYREGRIARANPEENVK